MSYLILSVMGISISIDDRIRFIQIVWGLDGWIVDILMRVCVGRCIEVYYR